MCNVLLKTLEYNGIKSLLVFIYVTDFLLHFLLLTIPLLATYGIFLCFLSFWKGFIIVYLEVESVS